MECSGEKRGRLIVFEGLDGSGKSTQLALLEKELKLRGRRIYVTREPTDAAVGGLIREALAGQAQRSGAELAALFLADRIRHNTNPVNGIRGYLESGVDVLCDRYYYSSFAYQGLESDIDWVIACNRGCAEIVRPELCIFLDVDAKKCKQRVDAGRAYLEIFEQSAEQLDHIRQNFFEVFAHLEEVENIVVVDAYRAVDEVAKDILDLVLAL
ncbi:MAG: dTMP kinase [Acetanaerobacterium sp.]